MNLNKIFSILYLLLFFTWEGSVSHAADPWSYPKDKPDGKFGGGTGDLYHPYLINNAQQLADLAYMVNHGEYFKGKYFKLTTDITLNENVLKEDGTPNMSGTFKNWTPIGEHGIISDDDFMGRFDGCGHTIRGLYMREVERAYQGLFGSIKSAEIKNLNFEDCLLQADYNCWGDTNIGIVIGTSYESTCMNIHVSKAWVEKITWQRW